MSTPQDPMQRMRAANPHHPEQFPGPSEMPDAITALRTPPSAPRRQRTRPPRRLMLAVAAALLVVVPAGVVGARQLLTINDSAVLNGHVIEQRIATPIGHPPAPLTVGALICPAYNGIARNGHPTHQSAIDAPWVAAATARAYRRQAAHDPRTHGPRGEVGAPGGTYLTNCRRGTPREIHRFNQQLRSPEVRHGASYSETTAIGTAQYVMRRPKTGAHTPRRNTTLAWVLVTAAPPGRPPKAGG